MKLNTVILDIDGSLMPIGGGLYVSPQVRDALLAAEKAGYTFILNSARESAGVLPLAYQLKMDTYGGYAVSNNGTQVVELKTGETFIGYHLTLEQGRQVWEIGKACGIVPCLNVGSWMIASDLTGGYRMDHHNCDADYIITDHYEKYTDSPIWKGCYSGDPEKLAVLFPKLKTELAAIGLNAVYSVPRIIDIIPAGVDKMKILDELFAKTGIEWQHCTAIGDTDGDVSCIKKAAYGVTLENGSAACKAAADRILPSVDEDGCLVWLKELAEHPYESH
ncbi:HAD family hydrolase [Catenisphaera adipataccumulans]|jgi:hydroxymethylpyrimidine pyrophosphatase-like HAD family hydrolase|uniref:Uncharacterized protein n=1 Tax=Catenisphaera adipataccumulans TaxID=700500 RepID=A0A7W8CZB2_9FIRM|nr:HAD family hydrolase [Catenisphaera adipataccumulans]MBB5183077.1 hypothetical protein [Catenisphaera adipataccumulans]